MKIVYKGKIDTIERVSGDTIRFKLHGKEGKVVDVGDKVAPTAKDSQMSMEFVLRPAMADDIRVGQTISVTVFAEDGHEP